MVITYPAQPQNIVMSVGKERLHHRLIEGKHRIDPVPVSPSCYIESEETGRFMTIHTHDERGATAEKCQLYVNILLC